MRRHRHSVGFYNNYHGLGKNLLRNGNSTNAARIASLFPCTPIVTRYRSEVVSWAVNSSTTAVQNVGVNHGRAHVPVA